MKRVAIVLATVPVLLLSAMAADSPVENAREDPKPKGEGQPPLRTKDVAKPLLDAHNRERAAEKLPPLSLNEKLTAAAQVHADDMAAHQKMTHEGSDGSTPFDRIKRQGYHYQSAGENVAEGWRTVEAVMSGWMNSPPHRANILGKFSEVGFAVARDDDGNPYWCADFATHWPRLDPAEVATELVRAINKKRAAADRPPLTLQDKLTEAASRIARNLARADSLDATKAPENDLARVLKEAGYRFSKVAESAASGQPGVSAVLGTWWESEDTRGNLLGDFSDVGVGYAGSVTERPYWCLILAKPAAR